MRLRIDLSMFDDYEKIPKLLFPFNEHYLMFAIAEALEKRDIRFILEFAIPVIKYRSKTEEYLSPPRLRTYVKSKIYPDLFLPEYGFFIEVENFYSRDPLKHFREYMQLLEMNGYPFYGCVLTWKCKKLANSSDIHFVDPITGKADIPIIKGKLVETLYYPGKIHTLIQYELFRWLRNLKYLCSAEIDVSESGHVFVPDEIEISSNDGIANWKPERFTPFSGWKHGSYISSVPREIPLHIDLCSYDGNETSCFEIKLPNDFISEKRAIRALQQLYSYITLNIFDKVWLVGPYHWLELLWEKAPEIFFGELRKLGLLGFNLDKRKFEIIKDAEELNVKKREYMIIKKF